jgi:hypothetical protein
MTNNGKTLETLVEFVEKTLLPQGFKITPNKQIRNDNGLQIAEFDIEINGKIGSTEITWLIECRDRPSQGPAPASWIEQLVGRRNRFNLNRVTAVSTTGFSEGAKEFAKNSGIEVREVKELTPECFDKWISMKHISLVERLLNLEKVTFNIKPDEPSDRIEAFSNTLKKQSNDSKFLLVSSGDTISIHRAYEMLTLNNPDLFIKIIPNKKIRLSVECLDNDPIFAQTDLGKIFIKEIIFEGEISLKETFIRMEASEYKNSETGDVISQVASFPFTVGKQNMALEMHKIPASGRTHILLNVTRSK